MLDGTCDGIDESARAPLLDRGGASKSIDIRQRVAISTSVRGDSINAGVRWRG